MGGRMLEAERRIPDHRLGTIDANWPEVLFINDYAMFMGYLSMAVTGMGFLVLTWSTVVLLGGFVSVLSRNDFWGLAVITLVQTRIFDVFLSGNISHIGYSFKRLWRAALFIALPRKDVGLRGAVRVLVFTIVLCPLFALYMFGLFVSPWISLWRLIGQDYGGETAGDSSKANLQPALVVLYSLALFQGVLFYYRFISAFEEQRLANKVASAYRFDDLSCGSVLDYLREIRLGCEKDPSFAGGRNLITYAAQLMESTSPDRYLSGARILDTLIRFNWHASDSEFPGQSMLICSMIGSASSGQILHNLVQMLDSKSPYDGEIRLRAARIVEHFAGEIRLDKILQGIQCISSLLDLKPHHAGQQNEQLFRLPIRDDHHISFHDDEDDDIDQLPFQEEQDHLQLSAKERDSHRQLQLTGMQILFKLSDDDNNLRLMSNTDYLAKKIVSLINTKGLHLKDHDQWSHHIAEPGVELISRFMCVTTRSSNSLRREISESREAIGTLESILECDQCLCVVKQQAIRVLTQISMDTSSVMGEESRERFIGSLIDMFLHNSKGSLFEKLAGEELVQLSLTCQSSATIILKKYGSSIIDRLSEACPGFYSSRHRKIASDILNHLYSHYSTDNEHFQNLKEAMIDLMPKVVREALGLGLTEKETQRVPRQASNLRHRCVPNAIHAPRENDNFVPYYYYPVASYSASAGPEALDDDYWKLQEALLSLCRTVYERMVIPDPDLSARFDEIAAEICREAAKPAMIFLDLVREAENVAAEAIQRVPLPILFDESNVNACCIS